MVVSWSRIGGLRQCSLTKTRSGILCFGVVLAMFWFSGRLAAGHHAHGQARPTQSHDLPRRLHEEAFGRFQGAGPGSEASPRLPDPLSSLAIQKYACTNRETRKSDREFPLAVAGLGGSGDETRKDAARRGAMMAEVAGCAVDGDGKREGTVDGTVGVGAFGVGMHGVAREEDRLVPESELWIHGNEASAWPSGERYNSSNNAARSSRSWRRRRLRFQALHQVGRRRGMKDVGHMAPGNGARSGRFEHLSRLRGGSGITRSTAMLGDGARGGATGGRYSHGDGVDYLSGVQHQSGSAAVVPGGRDKGDLGMRTKSTLVLVGLFLTIIARYRQTGCAILVAFLQWALFREGMAIVRDDVCGILLETEKGGARTLRRTQWATFWVLGLALYGRLLVMEISGVAAPSPWMLSFCRWHPPVCGALYVAVLLEFITSLKSPQLIMYQLGQFAAAHFACFLILPSALVSFASRAGLIWFVIPSASVIVNDIAAYICGRLFGRTPLTVLSPKKTREGFVGAAILTSFVGWLMGRWLAHLGWLTSPRNVLLTGHKIDLSVAGLFTPSVKIVPGIDVMLSPAEFHGFGIALTASLIGPFGGFMASGIKRAYGVKDFGNTIPGHGGAGDRFDCQLMLLPLVYFYLKAFAPGLDI